MPRLLINSILGGISAIVLSLPSSSAYAQIPEARVRSLGLESAWTSQVQLPIAQRPIVSTHLWASADEARQYAQTDLPGRSIRVYADTSGSNGKPMGIEWAKQESKSRAARILGKFDGIQPKVVSVPRVYLVVVTSDGVVQNFDAETGEILWRAEAGFANAPTAPAAVGKLGVALSHGRHLRLYDWKSGATVKTLPLRTATSTGVAMTANTAFVPSFSGVISAYSVGESSSKPWQFTGHGLPVGSPVGTVATTPALAALVTDKGYLYVFAEELQPTAWFRFETQSPFTGALSTAGDAFYAGDFIGNLFKVTGTRLGQLHWRFTTGSPIIQNPVPIGDRIYSLSENGSLFAIQDSDGNAVWPEPIREIKSLAASSKESLYVQTAGQGLAKIDAATGKLVAQTGPGLVHALISNSIDDRIYLLGRDGQLQCLREIGSELPTLHVQPAPKSEAKPKSSTEPESQLQASDAAAKPTVGADVDPFAAAAQPTTEASADAPANTALPAGDPFATPLPADGTPAPTDGTPAPADGNIGAATADPFASPSAPPGNADPFAAP